MTAPRAREQADPPSPPDRRPPRRGGGSSPSPYACASVAGRPAGPARLSGARRGLVRSVRALAAAALLALSGALALPATAQADVLVSNTGQADDGSRVPSNLFHHAQPFDTGSNTSGYNLDSVVLDFTEAPTGTGTLTVTVREDNAGVPSDAVLYTMTGGTVVSGENEFTAPPGATLDGTTLYHVVAEYDATGGPAWTRTRLSNGVDSGNADGWDIDEAELRGSITATGADWAVASSLRALQIQVQGSAKSGGGTPTCTLNTGDLWCGVVTVGAITTGGSVAAHGFAGTDGDLDDKTFSVGTNNYTIDGLYVGTAGDLNLELTGALDAADKGNLELVVGSDRLRP